MDGGASERRALYALVVFAALIGAGWMLDLPLTRRPFYNHVKVLDLPDVPAFQHTDGTYIDLGYQYNVSIRGVEEPGRWVGYLGPHRVFLTWDDAKLRDVMQIAGIPELPPEPRYYSADYRAIQLLFAVSFFGLGGLFVFFMRCASDRPANGSNRFGAIQAAARREAHREARRLAGQPQRRFR